MNTTINQGTPKLPQASAGQASSASQGTAGTTGSASASGSAAGSDHVNLTDSARALQEAARTDPGSVIDSKQVERIRQAIADGSYQVNPANIADRMLSLDAQIAASPAASPAGKV